MLPLLPPPIDSAFHCGLSIKLSLKTSPCGARLPTSWGWPLLAGLLLATALYLGGGALHNYRIETKAAEHEAAAGMKQDFVRVQSLRGSLPFNCPFTFFLSDLSLPFAAFPPC